MRCVRATLVSVALLTLTIGPARGAEPPPLLPDRMADTGGGEQLLTAVAPDTASTTGTLTWWQREDGRWREIGSAPARFGARGLTEGTTRRQGTSTTPTGIYDLPYAFGALPAPPGTSHPYRAVHENSWWCQDNTSRAYNRWTEPLAADCAADRAEHLSSYRPQYDHALVVGFNYDRPVRGRGAGIFLHVDGKGATAGCVSVPAEAMRRILGWVDPAHRPHIAIGTADGPTAIVRH
ncbi:L,D-transpeptidase family protein [Streptomyces sp. ZYX-F-203]